MRSFPLRAVALASLSWCAAAAHAQTSQATPAELEKVTVTGQGDKLGTGLMVNEDAPKSRSSVTKAQLDKTRSSGNPFQALTLLPGVNSSSYDATGLFGGNLRVRGFNSDQMGFTVNGAPVNDSGNFAVFPQEYIDQEDLCSLYVTQGAADADAPHVGASGGNVGIVSCAPEDVKRFRLGLSAGQLGYHRIYARVDTGKIGDFKAFVSISQSEAHKWKGYGEANRDHLDSAVEYSLGNGNLLSASLLYNHAVNNNFLAATPATFATNYYSDFGNTVPQHVPGVNGTAQTDRLTTPNYAGYSLNPFDDGLISAKGSFNLSDRLKLEVQPYFWYGYGTGGNQQVLLGESSGGNFLHGGIADINGDGDARDTVLVYRGSLTNTLRPGVTATMSYTLDTQKITGGVWYERARHKQTAPATRVDNAGNIGDIWLGSNLLKYNDGSTYQNRNWLTISTGEAVFVQDAVELLDHKLTITPAISYRRINRDFTNTANSGTNGGINYQISESYSKPLPSLGISYAATDRLQIFSSVQRSFRVPSNFEFGALGRGITYVNGVGTGVRIIDLGVKPETSINFDLGSRYRGDMFSGSATVFYNKFKDRIASSFNFADQSTTDTNVGPSTAKGVEIEAGTVPVYGFSAYVSGSYTKSTITDNLLKTAATGAAAVYYNTSGKQFPDTPKGMAAASIQYANGPYLLNVSGKYTSARSLTLSDDVIIKGFTTFDLNAAYKFADSVATGFKNPTLRLNVSNVLNRKYLLANAGSGSNVTPDATGNPVAYAGAPRFASVTFQVDY